MSHRKQQRKQHSNTFFGGAAILAVGIVMVKVISMFYKLPWSTSWAAAATPTSPPPSTCSISC